MKKLIMATIIAAALGAAAIEYTSVGVSTKPQTMPYDAKVLYLDVLATSTSPTVKVSTIRNVQSYTNCVKVAVVTNAIGEVSTVTNRWTAMKERKVYTNEIASVTATNGVGRVPVNTFIFGGDAVVATGTTNLSETVKAKLIIEK